MYPPAPKHGLLENPLFIDDLFPIELTSMAMWLSQSSHRSHWIHLHRLSKDSIHSRIHRRSWELRDVRPPFENNGHPKSCWHVVNGKPSKTWLAGKSPENGDVNGKNIIKIRKHVHCHVWFPKGSNKITVIPNSLQVWVSLGTSRIFLFGLAFCCPF